MTTATLLGLAGAALVGLGLYGAILQRSWLRRILSLNVLSSGIFLLYGIVARRGATADFGRDPVPQALVITGIVVAFAGSALAVALLLRWTEVKAAEAEEITNGRE
jgi:multicomponent Na+:H+ antiporter subunit C